MPYKVAGIVIEEQTFGHQVLLSVLNSHNCCSARYYKFDMCLVPALFKPRLRRLTKGNTRGQANVSTQLMNMLDIVTAAMGSTG